MQSIWQFLESHVLALETFTTKNITTNDKWLQLAFFTCDICSLSASNAVCLKCKDLPVSFQLQSPIVLLCTEISGNLQS